MHVHAGFGDPESRIRVMTALRRHLPLFHALSTSSPFYGGGETGLKSWRLNLLGVLPRTSIPGPLRTRAEYDRIVDDYRRIEVIQDGSEVWWDIRPSHANPTVELRICDTCPRLEDAASIIALYASLIRWLARLDGEGRLPPEPPTEIIAENRWLAQRYGVLAFLGDMDLGGRVDIEDYATELIEKLTPDARALACEDQMRPRAHHHPGGQQRGPASRSFPSLPPEWRKPRRGDALRGGYGARRNPGGRPLNARTARGALRRLPGPPDLQPPAGRPAGVLRGVQPGVITRSLKTEDIPCSVE